MKSVFMWSGGHFGFWDGDDLWSHHGKHVGRRRGSEIYAPAGRYLGESMANGRLTTSKAKAGQFAPSFVPHTPREKSTPEPAQDTYTLYLGYEDFPHPDLF
ncbi:MAG TPA: hypothetical protein VLV87_11045 [Gammaproteobacteria bacterium]|nr:hypothetical protein [Gammaproteobacteria bacterium]